MKRIISIFLLASIALTTFAPTSFASISILPSSEDAKNLTVKECNDQLDVLFYGSTDETEIKNILTSDSQAADYWLTCVIRTGRVKYWMIPYFARNVLQFFIALSGLISILFIMIGAYFYIAGGLTDDKEKGKKIVTYAIGGLILTTISWFLVNLILLAITS